MKKIVLFISTLLILHSSSAQSPDWLWAKGMGGTGFEYGSSIVADDSGNVYTTGYFAGTVDFDPGAGVFNLTSSGVNDIFISKFDSAGNLLWARRMGGVGTNSGTTITIDSPGNGSVYTTGFFNGTADFDPGAAVFNLSSVGQEDIFISKLDASGNFLWAKAFGGLNYDVGNSIAIDLSGNVYTTGHFAGTVDFDPGAGTFNLSAPFNTDIFISKLDASGNFVWAKALAGGIGYLDEGTSIAVDASGNVYTTGHFGGTLDFDPGAGVFNLTSAGDYDIFISKLDTAGNFVWAKRIGGTSEDRNYSIAIDTSSSGDVFTAGSFDGTVDFDPGAGVYNLTSAGLGDIFISKLDSAGNFAWAKAIGATSYDFGMSIALDPTGSGDVYTTGYFSATTDFDPGAGVFNLTSAGDYDIFISKLNNAGNFDWAKAVGGTSRDIGSDITISPSTSENVFVTGRFSNVSVSFGSITLTNAGSADILIAKLDTLSIPTGINDAVRVGNGVFVFPNPATNQLTIENAELRIERIEIYNVLGEKRLTLNPSPKGEELRIDVSSLAAGIYFVKVKGEKDECVAKFVKQ